MLRRTLAALFTVPPLFHQERPAQAPKTKPLTPEQALEQARRDIDTRLAGLRQELIERVTSEVRQQLRTDLKQELRAELRTELKQEIKQELRYELKSEIKQELKMELR